MTGLLLALVLAAGQPDAAGSVPRGTSDRPAWCQPGFVCIPTRDAADLTIRLADLQADLAAAKAARISRWGWIAGCGPSAVLNVNNGRTDFTGAIGCTIGLGLKIGR
jgi:hypothetical protein